MTHQFPWSLSVVMIDSIHKAKVCVPSLPAKQATIKSWPSLRQSCPSLRQSCPYLLADCELDLKNKVQTRNNSWSGADTSDRPHHWMVLRLSFPALCLYCSFFDRRCFLWSPPLSFLPQWHFLPRGKHLVFPGPSQMLPFSGSCLWVFSAIPQPCLFLILML